MSEFRYQAVEESGASVAGVIEADDRKSALRLLGLRGLCPSNLELNSANGATAGILWGLDNSTFARTCSGGLNCQVLYAYDATDLATLLYNSSQAANSRDVPGGAVKFATPIIANGKVLKSL